MDRFIVVNKDYGTFIELPLKSNMDRFIVAVIDTTPTANVPLKSNMDRFIEEKPLGYQFGTRFKIQYG